MARRAFARRIDVAFPLVRGSGALSKDPETFTRETPTIVNRYDIQEYGAQMQPFIRSFNDDDLLKNAIYYDIDAEYAAHDKLLYDASLLDGCKGPTGCQGWGPDGAAVLPKPGANNSKAYGLRREAWEHYINAAFMEERIKERSGVSKAQAKAEFELWKRWREWIVQYKKYLDDTMLSSGVLGHSNFKTMQTYDIGLQRFRNEYRTLLGREPAISQYTKVLPPDESSIPWRGILIVAGIGAAAYALAQVKGVAELFAPARSPARAA